MRIKNGNRQMRSIFAAKNQQLPTVIVLAISNI